MEWSSLQELKQNARELITREIFLTPRPGWTPGSEQAGPEIANALGRVMAENESLKRRFAVQVEGVHFEKGLRHSLEILAGNRITLSFFYTNGENWENTVKFRYLRLFKLLVPELYLGKTTAELSRFLGSILNPDLKRAVRKEYPTPSNTIKKLMADLNLLRLVRYITNGNEEVWEVTEYGKELYTFYRIRQFEKTARANAPKGSSRPATSADTASADAATPAAGMAAGTASLSGTATPASLSGTASGGETPKTAPNLRVSLEEATAAATFLAAVQAGYTENNGLPEAKTSAKSGTRTAKKTSRTGTGKTAASRAKTKGNAPRKKR
jgi:hypothetical protein